MQSLLSSPTLFLQASHHPTGLSSGVAPPFISFSRFCAGRSRALHIRRAAYPSASLAAEERSSSSTMAGKWAQKTVVIPAQRRGCHLITSRILREIEQDLSGFKCGVAYLFLQHTSASLTINENYDSDVQDDTETFLNRIVPEGRSAPWKHTLEGPDDMPAHIKSSMFGCSLTIPITDGRLNMGTWQGIWLCEHRDHATPRKVVVTMNGM
ncbi:unnamed protein product [Spirodela intermedia]|uniref:Uncharacterized protein n=1 Tax=Spirodela intermedia TaxID=51605 RepID=A0A7I8JLG4_SPIIN|nr:unnamed protein product [Spirodela intermedia]CAA6670413.1 unnamed protein product [Spirodela intermedia]